jgi:hypothetical protein
MIHQVNHAAVLDAFGYPHHCLNDKATALHCFFSLFRQAVGKVVESLRHQAAYASLGLLR